MRHPENLLFHCRGIFVKKHFVNHTGWRRCEKGVSSLQEPFLASISARKPAFLHRRQGNYMQLQ
jgi:hypothetical protein